MNGRAVTDYLNSLAESVTATYGCDCSHSGQTYVRAKMNGGLVWEGYVETFDLIDHPEATQAFAWGLEAKNGGDMETTAILNILPVNNPTIAVKAAIASGQFR